MKIPKISTRSKISEVNGLISQIIDEYKKGDYTSDAYLTMAFEKLTGENNRLKAAIMRDSVESELAELDEISDNEVSFTYGLVKGYTCHPDKDIAQAAEVVFKMVDKYGLEVKRKSYREQYPLLGSMIEESRDEQYAPLIARLSGCEVRFNLLEAAVNNFTAKQNAYLSLKDQEKSLTTATDHKKNLVDFFNDEIATYLEVMQKIRANTYDALILFVANRIIENNAAVRNRHNKSGIE